MSLVLRCTVPSFPAALKDLAALPAKQHAVLFVSGNDAATGQGWCPDCRRAEPGVVRAAAAAGAALLVVDVGEKPAWKDSGHPFRTDEALQLRCIPTLLGWDAGAGRAVEGKRSDKALEDAADEAAVEALCLAFFAK